MTRLKARDGMAGGLDTSAPNGRIQTGSYHYLCVDGAATYSAPLNLVVHQANLSSSGYTVTAELARPAQEATEWKVNGMRLAHAVAIPIATDVPYGIAEPFRCEVSIGDRAEGAMIENGFVLTVVNN